MKLTNKLECSLTFYIDGEPLTFEAGEEKELPDESVQKLKKSSPVFVAHLEAGNLETEEAIAIPRKKRLSE